MILPPVQYVQRDPRQRLPAHASRLNLKRPAFDAHAGRNCTPQTSSLKLAPCRKVTAPHSRNMNPDDSIPIFFYQFIIPMITTVQLNMCICSSPRYSPPPPDAHSRGLHAPYLFHTGTRYQTSHHDEGAAKLSLPCMVNQKLGTKDCRYSCAHYYTRVSYCLLYTSDAADE